MTTYWKPGTTQYRNGTPEEKEFLKNFGWEPIKETTKKNAAQPEPTAEQGEVADTKGE
jgi:hypothetical protein